MARRRTTTLELPQDPFPNDPGERTLYRIRATRKIALPPRSRYVYSGGDEVLLSPERAKSYASVVEPLGQPRTVKAAGRVSRQTRAVSPAASTGTRVRKAAPEGPPAHRQPPKPPQPPKPRSLADDLEEDED